MKVIAISDTHGHYKHVTIPKCDVLIHCGDITYSSYSLKEIEVFCQWFEKQPAQHKIFIAGNHDRLFEKEPNEVTKVVNNFDINYLLDQELIIDGVKFYGTPWQPWFYDWAFNIKDASERTKLFNQIPLDTNVLITHCPPWNILDQPKYGLRAGDTALSKRIEHLNLKLHLFGHIHEKYGTHQTLNTTYINASLLNERYELVNQPIEIDLH